MTDKGTLSFKLTGTSADVLRRTTVVIRDTSLKLRQSGLSDQTFEVDEGRYYVSTRMPDGDEQVLAGPIELLAGKSLELDLHVEATTDLRRSGAETPIAGHGPPPSANSADAITGAATPTIDAVLWQGSWLSYWVEQAGQRQDPVSVPGTKQRYTFDTAHALTLPSKKPGHDLLLALDEDHGGKMTFFAVPFDGPVYEPQWRQTRVIVTRRASIPASRRSEGAELAFAFDDPELTHFLEYVRKGLVRESYAYSKAAVDAARSELLGKMDSPLSAVVGAYVLLRANAPLDDELDAATTNLMTIAPSLPDVLPLRVEFLARTARHGDAIEVLKKAHAFGCPWFRSGVSYLLSRAKLYLGTSSTTTINLAPQARANITLVAGGLELLSAYVDPNRTVATYRDVPVAS